MSKGIMHNISKVAKLEDPARAERQNISDEQPTVADLVLPGTGYKFSDEFACYSECWAEREISHETIDYKRGNAAFGISG
jgi:hypothetical protein